MDTVKPYLHKTRTILATDMARQLAVSASLVFALLMGARGGGLLGGTAIKDTAGGAFAPDFTLLAPASGAFSIWSAIYLGLVGYTIFQWWPAQRRAPRQRAAGWLVAASLVLNACWILSAQASNVGLSLIVMILLLAVLLAAVYFLTRYPTKSLVDGLLTDAPVGLYTGWILVAAGANAASWLTLREIDLFGWGADVWAVITLGVVSFAGAVVAMTHRGRMSAVVALCWGLGWIAMSRLLGDLDSVPVVIAAGFGFFFVLVCGTSRRFRVGHEERRAFRRGYVPEI
ncbi:tryptophan-rich sensory protein [Crystallibacter degradans]|uniref:tryptophan-rich sensory protein n=1 Tax=Crystallibacter degradans TaxID=2726743 RepID=UPI001472D7B8|nr:tryptophan-rich sensory protein [Arthrobacter sp. SF27]NMR29285.1 tryptophan-rich sensory protein [Arthrobacter sp. SF27]